MENNETKTKEQCKVVREQFGGVPVSVRCTDDSLDEQAEVNTSVLYFYLIRSGKRTERHSQLPDQMSTRCNQQ